MKKNLRFKILLPVGFIILIACLAALLIHRFGGSSRDRFARENPVVDSNKYYNIHELSITKEDGTLIHGMLYLPNAEKVSFPLMILSHGIDSTMSSTVGYADAFAVNGIATYVFDYPGGSRNSSSSGSMKDMSVLTEVDDLSAVYDYFAKEDLIDQKHIFLQGNSQGGLVSALFAAQRPKKIAGMVLYYPAFVIPDFVRKHYRSEVEVPEVSDLLDPGLLGGKYYKDVLRMDPYKIIGAYEGKVLIFHGDADQGVPISYSEKAAETYKDATLITMEGAGHKFTGDQYTRAVNASVNFVKGILASN